MKTILLSLFGTLFCITLFASDTTIVRIHDHTDMTTYGNYDSWGELPDATKDYRKVYLNYTMGCATGGCSDWDYTSQIFVRHRTGEIDSTLNTTPTFTVNGNTQDTIFFSYNPVYIYSWDSINNILDSITSDTLEIIQFNDPNNPTNATGTLIAFESNINIFKFNSSGVIFDTIYFAADTSWLVNYYNWYSSPYDVIENYELARVITPYGSGLANNWEFTTKFDITDFVQILRDSVEIRCHYSGWSSGFSATLDFEFIEGTPARDVVKVENIYSGGYNYTSSSDFEANKLTPQTKFIKSNSSQAMLKMTTTGHGFDNNTSAAEFKPIDYFVNVDETLTHTQYNWDSDCGENPIFPQGGTWIYDRANWCPGKRAQAFNHEITPHITAGDSIELNIDFQAYSWNGTQTPSYIIECQLFQYEGANFSNSAAIVDIIKPSLKDEYSRKNPICGKPLITIRNYGSSPLTTLDIEYKVVGGSIHSYSWTGNLAFLETEEVELPNLSNWSGSNNTFEVSLSNPNGQADEYVANNIMQSEFEYVPEYPETFVLFVNTNAGAVGSSQISETSWDFYNENNNIEYTSGDLIVNSDFRDTLTFTKGCYTFIMNDTDEDGLDINWLNGEGVGLVRFKEVQASWLKSFDANFGTNIIHQFTIGGAQTTTSVGQKNNWGIYPNPTTKTLTIEGILDEKTKLTLQDNLGKIILEKTITNLGYASEIINLDQFKNGVYFIKISNSKEEITKKVVKI